MKSIAIDGPAGVGKSTLAKQLAEKLGYLYVDTGALYRALAVHFLDCGIPGTEEEAVRRSLETVSVEMRHLGGEQHVFLNGTDVTGRLRTPEATRMASVTSALGCVREKLLSLQRDIAAKENVIMDGRDIGTVVLPDATLKIFLTARPAVRARRRYLQLEEQGKLGEQTPESIEKEIVERDYRDSHRENAPLCRAQDAVEVDTSELSIPETEEAILAALEKKLGN